MQEFAFEGGSRGGPSFIEHHADRQNGLPGACAPMVPPVFPKMVKVYRVDGLSRAQECVGELGHGGEVEVLLAPGRASPADLAVAEAHVANHVRNEWGGGRYRIATLDGGNDFLLTVSGESNWPSDGGVRGVLAAKVGSGQIEVGATVWLELSRGGPFKVVGRYEHPLGAAVHAHHQNEPANTYERVRVTEQLWLCQDRKGVVHILAGGSLTTTEPAGRFSPASRAVSWCWGRREAVLWVAAIAGLAAQVL